MISSKLYSYSLDNVARSCGHIDNGVATQTVVSHEGAVRKSKEKENCFACQKEAGIQRQRREANAVEFASDYCKGLNLPNTSYEVWNDGKQVQISFWLDVPTEG